MALEDIFRALQQQAERDIEDVLSEARARAAGIVSEAESEAQRIRATHEAEAQRAANAKGVHSMNASRLEARRKLATVRQKAVQQAFDRARSELVNVRSSPRYEALFERLLDEALEGVEGDFELLVDSKDEDLARRALASRSRAAAVAPDLNTAGGVVVSTGEGKVFRRNTLEDRFEKLVGLSQAEVAERLFS